MEEILSYACGKFHPGRVRLKADFMFIYTISGNGFEYNNAVRHLVLMDGVIDFINLFLGS